MFVWLTRLNDTGFGFRCFWRIVRARLAVSADAWAGFPPLFVPVRGG
jgi:hypothetical protein